MENKMELIKNKQKELNIELFNNEYSIMLGFGEVDGVEDINKAIEIISKHTEYSVEDLTEDYYKPSCEIFFRAQGIAQNKIKDIVKSKYSELQRYSRTLR